MNYLKIKQFFNWKVLLFLIVLLGFVLRFYQLGQVPDGFHADEAAWGYNAYSILHTGKDEYGKVLPLVLKSFGDYKGAIYSYLDIPFIALLGLTAFATRIPSAIFAVLLIVLTYFFTKKLLKNEKIALLSSFLLAISPWHIILSRVTADFDIAIFFILLLAYSLLELIDKFNKKWFSIAVASGVLAIFTYTASRFFVILVVILFLLYSFNNNKRGWKINRSILLSFCVLLITGIVYTYFVPISRFNQVSIFSNTQTQLVLNEQLREDGVTGVGVLEARMFHNKIVNYTRTILQNTGQYFTFDYLFLNGGYPQRERVPDVGLFYIWEAPFLLIGIYAILRKKKRKEILLLAWWLILLIPTIITFDEIPNVHRNLVVLPAMIIIIAIGIYETFSYDKLKKLKILPLVFIIILLVGVYEFLYFQHQYFVHYDLHQPWYRGYAYKPLVADLEKYYPKFNKIIVTKSQSSPYIYILFYSKYDPKKYQNEGSPRDLDYTGFDKYFFVPLDCPLNGGKNGEDTVKGRPGILYVDKGTCKTPLHNAKLLDVINWRDGSPAFKLMEYVATGPAQMNSEY